MDETVEGLARVLSKAGCPIRDYVAANPDLADLSSYEAVRHLMHHGFAEGRPLGFAVDPRRVREALGPEASASVLRAAGYLVLAAAQAEGVGAAETAARVFSFAPLLRPLAVVGDSHALFWPRYDVVAAGFAPAALICSGGSARGLANPQSQSGYGAAVETLLTDLSGRFERAVALFKFGQVDLEFVYTFQRLAGPSDAFSPTDFERFVEEGAHRYAGFLRRLRETLRPAWSMIVQDVFPPALHDRHVKQGYVNAHIALLHGGGVDLGRLGALEYPDLKTRTRFHALFNDRLNAELKDSAVFRLHDFDLYLGPDGVIDPRCITRSQGTDHHLDFGDPAMAPTVRAACDRLREVLGPDGGS